MISHYQFTICFEEMSFIDHCFENFNITFKIDIKLFIVYTITETKKRSEQEIL